MRLFEIASAQEQMALWRLISDSVWAAIEQQAREQGSSDAQIDAVCNKLRGGSKK
jgi:hypothetical protein